MTNFKNSLLYSVFIIVVFSFGLIFLLRNKPQVVQVNKNNLNVSTQTNLTDAPKPEEVHNIAETISGDSRITFLDKSEDELLLLNSSGKDIDFKTFPYLSVQVTIPKDSKFHLGRHYEEYSDKKGWQDDLLNVELNNGVSVELVAGATGLLSDECGVPNYDDCNSKEIMLGGKKFELYTYKNNPNKMAGELGVIPSAGDILIQTKDEHILNEADINNVNKLLSSIKSIGGTQR